MKNKKKDNIIDFPTAPSKIERKVEAILFSASEPSGLKILKPKSALDDDTKTRRPSDPMP